MKLFSVVTVVTMSFFGFFAIKAANGLSCYDCRSTDTKCNTQAIDKATANIACGGGKVHYFDDAVTVAPPAGGAAANGTGAGNATTAVPSAGDWHCFKAVVKGDVVERGCKSGAGDKDCITGQVSCVVCKDELCNGNGGQSMLTGSHVHCAVISAALVVARMFQKK